jgi:polyhydroxyalkanoate synthesis repressor PhaR
MVVKKYSNRRLYDTEESRYITLEELAQRIRAGADVQVLDAKSGADLTQATLAQIILESRGAAKLLPTGLLTQLIRMGDDALAEFLGNYMTWALEVYLSVKRGAQAMTPYNPFAAMPLHPGHPFARFFSAGPWAEAPPPPPPPAATESEDEVEAAAGASDDVAQLRRELEELKRTLGKKS